MCGPDDKPPEGVEPCAGEELGDACQEEGDMCDAGFGCGAVLVCAPSVPKQLPGGCPKSLASAKQDVQYLDVGAMETLLKQLQGMKLATWRYREGNPARRLGFIIDDNPGSPAVLPRGDQVDVYAFTTMAVAGLKVQQQQIQALQKQVQALTNKLEKSCAAP